MRVKNKRYEGGPIVRSALRLLVLVAVVLLAGTSVSVAATGGLDDRATRPALYCGNHSLALRSDGSLWAWGINSSGAVGDGTTDEHLVPVKIGGDTGWVTVAGGSSFSLAVRADGTLWTWGSNYGGQLGDGTTVERHVPTQVGTDGDWFVVAGGSDHCLGLKADGSLWAWGGNAKGQLGDGTTIDQHVPTRIGSDADWETVACGSGFSLALKADGSLWAWGANQYGQLGDGTTIDQHVPARIGSDADWETVACGPDLSLALKSYGTLWTWGNNVKGELGDGTTAERLDPGKIGTTTTWLGISAGGFGTKNGGVSMALQADGSLWTWGFGRHGELGDGERSNRLAPFQVLTDVRVFDRSPGGDSTFSDVPATHPYFEAISAMADAGAISGYPDGTFRPDGAVLRQHFAKMIVGAMGLPVTESAWQDERAPFTDCGPDYPADLYPHDYIAVARAHNLTAGKTATTFAPAANITRAQIATMVVRAAINSGTELTPAADGHGGRFESYLDPVHATNVHVAERNGLLDGLVVVGDPRVWIAGNATRGEVAQILSNLMGLGRTDHRDRMPGAPPGPGQPSAIPLDDL